MTPKPLIVRPQGRGAVIGGHPWIMSDSLVLPAENLAAGTAVELVDNDGKSFGEGLFNPNSRIAVRRFGNRVGEPLNEAFFSERLERAFALRKSPIFDANHRAIRLVFSEGDDLSGLIIDRFGDYSVLQQTAAVFDPMINKLAEQLASHYALKGVLHLVDESTSKLEGIEARRSWIVGEAPAEEVTIEEHGLSWSVDLQSGQKTGFYYDQRDNRLAAARWMPNHGRILDVCCYVGGFALNIARLRPDVQIIGIDTSRKAIESATCHAELNRIENTTFEVGDFLRGMELRAESGEKFQGIVLDPPKLAGSRDNLERAMRAYHRLNALAVRLLEPGGILVTCSCSGRVSRFDFWNMLRGVAKQTRRSVQILEQRTAAPDHPVSATCPETDYLKCFICRVI